MSTSVGTPQSVSDVVGQTLAATGVTDAFGVLGSGNLIVTNALCSRGARFHHARREDGAICMADGYARVSGNVGICSLHQGPGLTNAVTGLTEAVKSRTPLLVLAGESPAAAPTSNFHIDQPALAASVGAASDRVKSPATAPDDAQRAYQRAVIERRPVLLNLPIDIQPRPPEALAPTHPPLPAFPTPDPSPQAVAAAADLLQGAQRPVILAGRGAVLAGARDELERLGAAAGALLATSAPANGLFAGLPYALGISGGFAVPFATELLPQADVVIVFGASVNHWTTRHGRLIAREARLAHVDIEPRAFGLNHHVDLTMLGDAAAGARLLADELERRGHRATGWRTEEMARDIAANTWAAEPYEDASSDEGIDPRTLSIALERHLPAEKAVVVDSGHFLGYPAMFLTVPDARAWVFPNGFQSVGLGLGNAIGAAIARPDRVTVAAIGDGGAFMALAEIETAARLGLKLLVLIYDDRAYGAEVHHFAPMGHDVSLVQFPDADLAAIARACGAHAATVRRPEDLDVVDGWLAEPQPRPLVLDAKVNPTICAEWLSEAFHEE
ncbi:MAG TPA: thiamine pyrophosphate-binding protein [Solirubrobacteraceae bacterium]|jgi:thiamine pyrophosphate-dependent acetolactate synthase large subunit-like protein